MTAIDLVGEMRRLMAAVKTNAQDRLAQLQLLKQELACADAYPTLIAPKKPVLFPFVLRQNRPAYVCGLNTEKVHVFKSAKKPFLLTFYQRESDAPDMDASTQSRPNLDVYDPGAGTLQVIVKYNDDVRPDVMVLQLFKVMDNILKNCNLRLEATHYAGFAFDPQFGLVECVQNVVSLDDIIGNKQVQTIVRYLQQ